MFIRAFVITLFWGWIATDLTAQTAHWFPPHSHMHYPYHPYPYHPYPYHPYPAPYPPPASYPYPYPYPSHWNPTVAQTPNQFSGLHYDPSTGRWTVDTTQSKVKESATDPNRTHIDPGSWRQVDRWEGNTHVTGSRWTSYGIPHSNLHYHTVGPSAIPGINQSQTTNVFRSTGPANNGPSSNANPAGINRAKKFLKQWDANADGSLDHEELAEGLKALKSSKE